MLKAILFAPAEPSDYGGISFPGLGLEVDPPRVLEIGSFSIHYYGLIIAIGLLLAAFYGCRRSKHFGIKEDDILDGVLWVTPFAILCARIYYVIFAWNEGGYSEDPISALYIWNGGLAIYGGVLGAVLGVAVFCKFKKIKLPALLDLVALGFLIGQGIGRWGNFMNREAFGGAVSKDYFLAMGLTNQVTGQVEYYHPTFLYESVWNLTGFVILHIFSKRRRYDGQIALGYMVWYGLGRAIIEGLRVDSLYWGPIRVSQALAALSCIAGAALLVYFWRKPPKGKMFVDQRKEAETKDA